MNKKRLLQVSVAAAIAAVLLIPGNIFVIGQVLPDTTAPSVTITQPTGGANLNTANVTVTGTATDNVGVTSVEIFLDNLSQGNAVLTPANGTSVSWSMTLTLLAQGAHNIIATAKDNANNTQSASVNFVVDTVPPSILAPLPITVQANTAGGALNAHPNITAYLAGALTLDAIDPNPTVTNNAPALFPLGTTTVTFTSTDDAGNSASDLSTVTVVDTILPSVTITQPVNGTKLNTTSITVSGTVSDTTVASVEILVDNVSQGNAALNNTAWTKALTLAEGFHTITAKAKDGTNNTASTSISVVIDTTTPTVSITTPANNANLNTSNVGITGTAADANGVVSVHVSIDNGVFTLASGTTSWSFSATLPDGIHTITAKATDMAGNTNKANVTITVSTLSNAITITSPANGTKLNSANVTITGTVNSPSNVQSVKVSIDGATPLPALLNTTSGVWKFGPITLVEGSHTATATLTNLANNTASATASFIVDTTPPLISITSPANNATLTATSVKVNGTASDANGITSVVVSIDSGPASATSFDPTTGKWTLQTTLTNGTHTIKATATDMAGNKVTASISVKVLSGTVVDTVIPSIEITSLGVTAIVNGTNANRFNVTIAGTASDNNGLASVQVKIDDGTFSNAVSTTAWSFKTMLNSGTHTITAKATDNAGNMNTEMISLTLQSTTVGNQLPPGNQPPALPPAQGQNTFSCNGQQLNGKLELEDTNATFIDCEIRGSVRMEDSTAVFKNSFTRGNLKVEDSNLTFDSSELRGNLHMEGGSLVLKDNMIRGNVKVCDTEMTQIGNNIVKGHIELCGDDEDDEEEDDNDEEDEEHAGSSSGHSSSGSSGSSHEKGNSGSNGNSGKDNGNDKGNSGKGSSGDKGKGSGSDSKDSSKAKGNSDKGKGNGNDGNKSKGGGDGKGSGKGKGKN